MRQLLAERHAVTVGAHRGDVDGREVGGLARVDGEPGLPEPEGQGVTSVLQTSGEIGEVVVAEAQPGCDRRLEGRPVHIRQELLGLHGCPHQRLRPADPADLPSGGAERLAAARDGQRAFPHPRQVRHRDVLATVEDEVLVDLVGHHQQVVLERDLGDGEHLGVGEHLPGRVVRGVQQDEARARGDRRTQTFLIEGVPVDPGLEGDRHDGRAGERDAGLIRVEHRLEHDDLVAVLEDAEERPGECLGGSGGDEHLGVGIDAHPPEPLLVLGDGLTELGDAEHWWILVLTGADRRDGGVEHLGRSVGVGKPLTEVDHGGVFGSMLSTPIINPPQSGILGMHNIIERPIAVNGKVEVRPMMYVALSYDHRIIDGKESVGFLVAIKEALENPQEILMDNNEKKALDL